MFLLHGFGRSPSMWSPFLEAWERRGGTPGVALELAFHGADSVESFEAEVERLAGLIAKQGPAMLVGYSLGGRLALALGLRYPELLSGLVLLGTNPGIDEAERAGRQDWEEGWATLLENEGIEAFAEQWSKLPLFAAAPEAIRRQRRLERCKQDPSSLAQAMRVLGLGRMASAWGRLGELTMPVGWIAGGEDAKFCALGERAAAEVGRLECIAGAGHDVPLEAPEALAEVLWQWAMEWKVKR